MATWASIAATFRGHFRHYADHGGGENALVGLRAEGAVTLQYAGRVVYELFQNALDRARTQTVVRFDGATLIVGNDGDGVTVDPAYDYDHPIEGEGRSDFHALCALHTSNKSPDRQFGNKGIGFRSVFGVADRVRLWSRCADGGWWGLELRQRLVPSAWPGCALPELDALVGQLGERPRPSFHFPRLLRTAGDPVGSSDGMTTLVQVEIDGDKHSHQIRHEVDLLQRTRFQFVGLRRPGISFVINDSPVSSDSGWPLVTGPSHHAGFAGLAPLARRAEHPVTAPRVAVAWIDEPERSELAAGGLFYNHLPTRMSTGLSVDVHADFQVKADREGMALDTDNAVGEYNLALLNRAARAHVEALRAAAVQEPRRQDLWRLADRPRDASPAWVAALRTELFPGDSLAGWVDLAADHFRAGATRQACREFWSASLRWLETLVAYGHWTKTWRSRARELCDALSAQRVAVIPVVSEGGQRAVPVPSRQDKGKRAARRVFYWSPRGETELPPIPETLLEMGRVVTAFPMGAFEGPAGIQPFAEAQVLPELRQLPNDPSMLDTERALSPDEQGALLLFAHRLAGARRVAHFAWRAFAESDDAERIGRALATMFLPTTDDAWEPARQLSEDRVDRAHLAELMGLSVCPPSLLRVLGVAPPGGVPLVEGGAAGFVSPAVAPPAPQEAGTRPVASLAPLLPPGTLAQAVLATMTDLPGDTPRSRVYECVHTQAWVCSTQFRVFEGVPPLPAYVAPLDVVLHSHDPQRVFFAVPTSDTDTDALRRLGAMQRPDDDAAADRVPLVLRGLAERLTEPSSVSASVGMSLAALYNRLTRILPLESSQAVPVLVEHAGRLGWLGHDEQAWLARREERQELRRFFTDVPLVAAEHREGLAERLDVGQIRLRKRVLPDVTAGEESSRAALVRDAIQPYLPVLAAVADQSRQVARTLSAERFQRAWHLRRPIVEVEDAWVELSVEGPDREPIAWRKGEYDDVFHLPGRSDTDPGVVIFDADPRSRATADRTLPLRYFGDAIAVLLVNNANLGARFAQVLASIDECRVADFCERHHLGDLIREWTSRLRPLSDQERELLIVRLGSLCVDAEEVLHRGRIAGADLRSDLALSTATEVEELLRRGLSPGLRGYLPRLVVAADNEASWRDWAKRRWDTLSAMIDTIGGVPKGWRRELRAQARSSWDRLAFSPALLVTAFLGEHGHTIEDLEAQLDAMTPTFHPVSAAPLPTELAGWRAGRGTSGTGKGGPQRKLRPEDLLEESMARGVIGDAAEKALLTWVVEHTESLRAHEGFEDALLSVFRSGTKTWREVKRALEDDDLEGALHVANRWSGAGFDILGLEVADGEVVPVRYECKGISATSPRVRVFLSRNELGVARRVYREGPGRWMLVGVQPDGECVDLTSLIEDLLHEDEEPLEALYERGLEPDGLRLVVERSERRPTCQP